MKTTNRKPTFSYRFFSGLLTLAALCLLICNKASGQNYWMQRAGGSATDEGLAISLDDSNNTYTTGYFSGSVNFGTLTATSLGVADIFVAKTNSNGLFKWVVNAGGSGVDRGLAIKADANGNTYVTGFFYNTATFDKSSIVSAGNQDVFVAKYDRNANLKWVVRGGGTQADIGNGITIDNSGNVYVTGQFTDTAVFGAFTLKSTGKNINVFTVKLDSSNGNFLWAKAGTGPHTDKGIGVACDTKGNVYVTGQFTDTVTFGTTHYSTLYNAIFLVKYNSSGTEQWFTKIGGGTFNEVSSIASDANSNIYLTGNFTGILSFYATTTTTLTNKYSNRIFVAKYDTNANLKWSTADGSDGGLTSNSIAVDNTGNPYIIGNFECVLNSYADNYGQGTFNTVGYWDIFVSQYNATAGLWQWSRQIGGHMNNYGNGIAVSPTGDVFNTGSFDQDMIVTTGANFIGYTPFSWGCYFCNNSYCSDPLYGAYEYFNTYGNLDIFVAKAIDLSRQPYDYYARYGTGCDRPYEGVCIINGDSNCPVTCPDTVTFCYRANIYAYSKTCDPYCMPQYGPNFTYNWSIAKKNHTNNVSTSSSEWVSVVQTSADGCFVSTDSVYVHINPLPPPPPISDNVVINTNSTNPTPIRICRDSIILTGGTHGSETYYWGSDHSFTGFKYTKNLTVYAPDSDYFTFFVIDSNGCENVTTIKVVVDTPMQKIVPALKCITCSHDTAVICRGGDFTLLAYDTISNPSGSIYNCIPVAISTTMFWTATPDLKKDTIYEGAYSTTCYYPYSYDINVFIPYDSGWYHITDTIVRKNTCDTSISVVSDSIYVIVHPIPNPIVTITGNSKVCPGGLSLLTVSGAPYYQWSTGSTLDTIRAHSGFYEVEWYDTNKYGCTAEGTLGAYITTKATPKIIMNPSNGIVCPGDSVQLTCTSSSDVSFTWQGPSGNVGGDTSVIYVKTPGFYYCIAKDSSGCVMLSNTVYVNNYGTPYLVASPNSVICPGDTARIDVVASKGATIQWQAPLTGSDTFQLVTVGGTYTCKVTSCGITTLASVVVTVANPIASITPPGPLNLCAGDSVKLTANSGMSTYIWYPGSISATSIEAKKPGTYTLVTIDNNGCTAKDSITIIASDTMPSVSLSIDSICPIDSVTLSAKGGGTYKWLPGGASTSSIKVAPSATKTYSVIVTNSCGVDTLPVTVHIESVTTIGLKGNTTLCLGQNTSLTASGGTHYNWVPSAGLSCTNCSNPTATPTATTTYTLSIANGNCIKDTTITITVNPPFTPTITPPAKICAGDSVLLVATGGGTYKWSTGATTSSIKVSPISNTSYTVVVFKGCIDSATTTVSVYTSALNVCCSDTISPGDTVRLNATGATSYVWLPDAGLSCFNCPNPVASPTVTTTYTITTSDSGNCPVTKMLTIYVEVPCSQLDIPNIFTPNNDGRNDDFVINVADKTAYSIVIYDRWGKEVYSSTDPGAYWNGRIMNTDYLVPDGVYYYIVKYTCGSNNYVKKGFVTVLR